jgi:hypothetical protein
MLQFLNKEVINIYTAKWGEGAKTPCIIDKKERGGESRGGEIMKGKGIN